MKILVPDETSEALFELAFKMKSNRRDALLSLGRAGKLAHVFLGDTQGHVDNDLYDWLHHEEDRSITTTKGKVEPPKVGSE